LNKSSYRTDIDCLRGVAVLFVIMFHFGVKHFGGGYIGVDIFFVISGYLITRIIYGEAVANRFSFVHFYERRIRRIVPAVYALLAGVSIMSLFYLLPDEYLRFSQSAVSVLTFVSNILFWQEAGYFAQSSLGKPLLHTWSLAVEEQFYLVFPAVINLLTRRVQRQEFWWLAGIALASFALSAWSVRFHPDAGFYLAPGRAWEFLLGSLLAVPGIPAPKSRAHRLTAAWLGIAMMVAPVFLLKDTSPFPGLNALPPCLGAALVIWANTGTEGRPARNAFERVLVFFGAISYSLYLWHWPVLIFYRRMLGTSAEYTRLTSFDKSLMFLVSVTLAYGSYRWIEQPVRRRIVGVTRRSLFTGTAVASVLLVLFGVAGIVWDGFPARVDPEVAAIARYATYKVKIYQVGECHMRSGQTFADLESGCLQFQPNEKNVLLWGDSVVAHYIFGFETRGGAWGIHFMHASMSACPPVIGFVHPGRPNCSSFNDDVFKFVETKRPDAIVMAATWNVLVRQFGYDSVMGPLHKTVSAVAALGIPVVLYGPPVEFIDNLPYILSRFAISGLDRFDAERYMEPTVFSIDARMQKEFSDVTGVHYVSVRRALCNSKCPAVLEGPVPLTWDIHHLTREGSLVAAEKLLPKIKEVVGGQSPSSHK
jgi:peptidoglycan/LPS O-acetylase OafA/YrhL